MDYPRPLHQEMARTAVGDLAPELHDAMALLGLDPTVNPTQFPHTQTGLDRYRKVQGIRHLNAREVCIPNFPTKARRIRGDCAAEMHSSLWPWWWLLGWRRREIPEGACLHRSVRERREVTETYRPRHLPRDVQVPAQSEPRGHTDPLGSDPESRLC